MIKDIELLGQRLIQAGFKTFFLYLFKAIEQRKFIIEPMHQKMFEWFENIYKGKKPRSSINLPPRAGKTTFAEWILVFTLTVNPKAQIIYTSYSQSLLSEISNKVASILENPIYKALFPHKTYSVESEETTPIDDFWRDYLVKENGEKNAYSSKLVKTYAGGICLFSAIGSQITGFGCGIRGAKGFTGMLIIDDANKPADIHSEVMRSKVIRYFEETLLSRLNNPYTPIINIQQRLHIEDISGALEEKYKFEVLRIPLLDDNGNCNLPSQYNEKRIRELQINNYMFQAQYQQMPIISGGAVIKREWFKYYSINENYLYNKIVIAGDTAISVKESADYSCFLVGGITQNNQLHILDMVHGKWEYPTLKEKAVEIYNKWQRDKRSTSASAFYIEDRASGQQLCQDFAKIGLPIIPIEVTKDKLARIEEILDFIASGNVLLPDSEMYGFNPKLLRECEEFVRDMTHRHDDIPDCLAMLINNSIANRQISILDVL